MEDHLYCRLCMEDENLLDMDNSIIACIKNEIAIDIQDNDELSKEICAECHKFITEIIEFNKKREEMRERVEKFKLNADKKQKLLQKIVKRKDSHVSIDVPVGTSANTVTNEPSVIETARPSTPCKTDKTNTVENSADTNTVLENNDLISKVIKSINLDEVEKTAEKLKLIWNPRNNFCNVCKIKLDDFEKFKKHAKSESHRLKSNVVKKCGNFDIFSTHTLGYRCDTCKKILKSKAAVVSHGTKDHKQFVNKTHLKPVVVPKNKNIDEKKDDEERRLSEVKVKDEPDTAEVNVNPINKCKEHPCKYCSNRSFGFIESLLRHMKKHHKGVHLCIHCDFTSTSNKNFSDHVRKHYNLTRLQRVCSLCFKIFNSQTDLLSHRKKYHCTKILQMCSICNASFTNATLLKKHQRSKHGMSMKERRPLKSRSKGSVLICLKCQKPVKPSSLKTHMLKCSLVMPAPSNNVPTKSKISRVQELSKKIDTSVKNHDEKVRESRPPVIQPSSIETESLSKKREVDPAEISASKKLKTVPEELARPSTSNAVHFNTFSSITGLNKRGESCAITLTEITPQSTNVKQTKPSSVKKHRKKRKRNLMKAPTVEENTIACKTCGMVFRNAIFLSRHESTDHSASATTVHPTSSNLVTNRTENIKSISQSETNHRIRLSEASTYDNATQFCELKRKQTAPATYEKNEQAPKENARIVDRSAEISRPANYSTTPSTQSTKITELNKRVPEKNFFSLGQSTTIQRVVNYPDNSSSTPKNNHQSPDIQKLLSHPNVSSSTPKKIDTPIYRLTKIQVPENPNKTSLTPKKNENITDRPAKIHESVDHRTRPYSTPNKNLYVADNLAEIRRPSSHAIKSSSTPKKNEYTNERSIEIREFAINPSKSYSTPKKNDYSSDRSADVRAYVNYPNKPCSTSNKSDHVSDRLPIRKPANCSIELLSVPKNNGHIVDQSSGTPVDYSIKPSPSLTMTSTRVIDRSWLRNHVTTNNQSSFESPEKRIINLNYQSMQKTSSSSTKIGASTTKPVVNSTSSKHPPYSGNDSKKINQLTVIQSCQSTCLKCKNPETHPCCNLCILCFQRDDMRYLIHMSTNHPDLIKS